MKFSQAVLNKNGLLQKIPNSKYWVVKDEFVWFIDYETKKEFVVVQNGFMFDFGSIPKIFQNIFSPTRYISFLLHDLLYSEHGKIQIDGDECQMYYTRKDADIILLKALKVEGAGLLTRRSIYLGVRLGGFLAFKK